MAANLSRLHPTLRTIARNIPRVAASLGFNARVTSGYRSRALQAKLYREYIEGRAPYVVAPPGTSIHEKGLAIDVVSTDTDALASLLASVGLSWAGPSDPVHFTLRGAPASSYAKKGAGQAWAEGPGSAIPDALTYLPIIGTAFSTLKNPVNEAKSQASKLLDVILGFF